MDRWQTIDLRSDPDEPRFDGDPHALVDALEVLLEVAQRPAWHAQAACRGAEVEFFTARGESVQPAKDLCRSCPVRDDCLSAAVAHGERHGVWGGLSERERRRLRRAQRPAA